MPSESERSPATTPETVCFEVDDFTLLATPDAHHPVLKVQSGGHCVCVDGGTSRGNGSRGGGTPNQLERSARECRDLLEWRLHAEGEILRGMKEDTPIVRESLLLRSAGTVAVWISYFQSVHAHFEEKRRQAENGVHALEVAAGACDMICEKVGNDQALARVLHEIRDVCRRLSRTCAQLAPAFDDHRKAYYGLQSDR